MHNYGHSAAMLAMPASQQAAATVQCASCSQLHNIIHPQYCANEAARLMQVLQDLLQVLSQL